MQEQVVTFHKKQPQERIKRIAEVKDVLFSELKVLNVILTNACNLSCSYCFEQHKKDYGKFTQEQLKQVYDFFLNANDVEERVFQFFGGEPLAQKKKILDFCREFKDELSANKKKVRVSIVTNALLLTEEFLEEYCSYDFTSLVISLDTDHAETNRRELTQENIEYIFKMIKLLPTHMTQEAAHFAIRCTINEESVPHLESFMERLYQAGVRNFVIHPLIMGREQGVIEWVQPASESFRSKMDSDDMTTWHEMRHVLFSMMNARPDFFIHWAEGVGVKGESNCMVGSDMIAMDASGDFSGCYFFTNLKENAGHTMLGNVFRDEIYIDRYVNFQKTYVEALKHEECQSCNLKNFCYQCPAGNISTGDSLFRPDGMCKQIVQLFVDIREHSNRQLMKKKLAEMTRSVEEEGPNALARTLLHLMYIRINDQYLDTDEVKAIGLFPDYRKMVEIFYDHAETQRPLPTVEELLAYATLSGEPDKNKSVFALYCLLAEQNGVPAPVGYLPQNDVREATYFITYMHLLVIDKSGYTVKYDPGHSRSQILDL